MFSFHLTAENPDNRAIDLNTLLIPNRPATYFFRMEGDALAELGVFAEDILIVDASLQPRNNELVLMNIDGEWQAKKLDLEQGPRGDIFGVITSIIRSYRGI